MFNYVSVHTSNLIFYEGRVHYNAQFKMHSGLCGILVLLERIVVQHQTEIDTISRLLA